jgi:hypothetical protein
MKAHKRLKKSLEAIQAQKGKIPFRVWIAGQPGSTRRGIAKGNFQLPNHVTK